MYPPQLENFKFKCKGDEKLSQKIVGVRLPEYLDRYVRSRGNRAEWLVEAVKKKFEEEVDN